VKPRWKIQEIRLETGERLPVLISDEEGLPLFKPTVYITSMIRNAGKSESTSEANLKAIMFLYYWGQINRIDIEERFRQGEFLTLQEIEKLCMDARYRYDRLGSDTKEGTKPTPGRKTRTAIFKRRKRAVETYCQAHSVVVRLRYIRNYLDWLAGQRMARVSPKDLGYAALFGGRQNMINAINTRLPRNVRGVVRDPDLERMGLTHEIEESLLEVIEPHSIRNPFKQEHVKVRNQVLLLLMLKTGIRRGELLGIRISDLNLQENMLTVHRVPIDPLDPRRHKPQTKTLPRRLRLEPRLAKLVRDYLFNHRRQLPMVGKHPFLFVESRRGKPLTHAAVNDIFVTLRETIPELPPNFSPHFLRYTWNDRFSEFADEKIRRGEWTNQQEEEVRSYLMGWIMGSGMAALYSKRHIRKKAEEFSLARQRGLFLGDAQ
jgi:integrase